MIKPTINLEHCSCPNNKCERYGRVNSGNIAVRGKYGKNKDRPLLYCRCCGKRFAYTQGSALFGMHLSSATVHQIIHHTAEGVGVRSTARLLGMNKDTVNRVILRVGQYVSGVLSELMTSLELTEIQLDELWTFVKKKKTLKPKRILNVKAEELGSGQR